MYPEAACARIIWSDQEYRTINFKETEWWLSSPITLHGARAGAVEVYYLRELPEQGEGPFLKEERTLLNAIADLLGRSTERRMAEEALRESEEWYRIVMENISDCIFICGFDGHFRYMSPSLMHLTSYSAEELIGKHFLQFIHKDYQKSIIESIEKQIRGKIDVIYQEYPFVHKDGSAVWIEQSVRMVKNRAGELEFFGVVRDITRRREADKQLRRIMTAVEQSPAAVVITNAKGTIEYVNPRFTDITLYSPDEAIGQNPRILKSGTHAPEFYTELWSTITSGRTWRGELYNKKKNGEFYWESASISPVCGDGDTITNYIAVKEDITERKLVEEALRKSEEKYRTILKNIKEGYYEIDLKGNFTFVNESLCKIFGRTVEEMINMNYKGYLDEEYVRRALAAHNKVFTTGESGEIEFWRILRKDGTRRYIECSINLIIDSTGAKTGFMGMVRDITERKLEEQERERLILELQKALDKIKTLKGILPICASCKKIRNDTGYWEQIEVYIRDNSDADFSHSICPDCAKKLYPDFDIDA